MHSGVEHSGFYVSLRTIHIYRMFQEISYPETVY